MHSINTVVDVKICLV